MITLKQTHLVELIICLNLLQVNLSFLVHDDTANQTQFTDNTLHCVSFFFISYTD